MEVEKSELQKEMVVGGEVGIIPLKTQAGTLRQDTHTLQVGQDIYLLLMPPEAM